MVVNGKKVKTKALIVFILIFLLFIIISFSVFIAFRKSNNTYSLYENHNNYVFDAKYKKTGVKELDNKVVESILHEKTSFVSFVKNSNSNSSKYELNITCKVKKYNNIFFASIYVNRYSPNSVDSYKKINLVYNKKSKKFTTIKNYLKDENSLQKLSLLSLHLLNKYAEDHSFKFSSTDVKEMVKDDEKHFSDFYFDKDGMTIIFNLHQVSSNNIPITIPWSKASEVIKDKYTSITPIERNSRDISNFDKEKLIAFTFDDGPSSTYTKLLLDNLDKYDARVTFFVLGSRVSSNKEVIKRAYTLGNDIGSHTYSHKYLPDLSNDEIIKEIEGTNKEIKDVIGVEPVYIRPPYGSTNTSIKNKTIMHTICWNVDSLDWKTKDRKKIKKVIVNNATDGSIVLLHDIYKESVYGALLAMEELKKQGYNFVTISEMALLKNVVLDYDKNYYGF